MNLWETRTAPQGSAAHTITRSPLDNLLFSGFKEARDLRGRACSFSRQLSLFHISTILLRVYELNLPKLHLLAPISYN